MARKVKTPPPPRRVVQAPKQRTAPKNERRNRLILYAIAASGFVMIALVGGILFLAGAGDDDDGPSSAVGTIRDAGWTYEHPKSQGRTHVPELAANFKYNSTPPTSGPHSNQTVAYGAYDEPISELHFVHNLEHGAVGIFYGDEVPDATIARLQEYYNGDPNGIILAPDPRLGDQIALTAWTHLAKGKTFDQEVFDTFIDAFGFKGPESCKTDLEQGCFRRADMDPSDF
ncbi:MAG: DUF3105 domain-containing protein [Actinomycetota bacterium]|nr:DUF3105 domain-containing protein [Actinomycetota bacterium]